MLSKEFVTIPETFKSREMITKFYRWLNSSTIGMLMDITV